MGLTAFLRKGAKRTIVVLKISLKAVATRRFTFCIIVLCKERNKSNFAAQTCTYSA
jgi:hypothetical protein